MGMRDRKNGPFPIPLFLLCPGKNIIGVPTMRPTEYRRLKKRERRVNRAYGAATVRGIQRLRHHFPN